MCIVSLLIALALPAAAQDAASRDAEESEAPEESATRDEAEAPADAATRETAPAEPVPAKPPTSGKAATSGKVADAPTADGVGFFAGVHVGPAISLSPLSPTVVPRLEVGVELPVLERSLRIFAAAHYLRPVAEGQIDDPRVEAGSYSYRLEQQELAIALGPTLRLPGLDWPVVPEVSVAPQLTLYESRIDGEAGGQPFGETTEQFSRIGIYAALGAALPLGPGELAFQVALTSSGLDGVITGEASSAAIAPLLGYRLVF